MPETRIPITPDKSNTSVVAYERYPNKKTIAVSMTGLCAKNLDFFKRTVAINPL
jgi:hypothetical protein